MKKQDIETQNDQVRKNAGVVIDYEFFIDELPEYDDGIDELCDIAEADYFSLSATQEGLS